jgi:Undecaprenyl-phosphate glucose phosphotransferase
MSSQSTVQLDVADPPLRRRRRYGRAYSSPAADQIPAQRSSAADYGYSRTSGSEMSAVLGIDDLSTPRTVPGVSGETSPARASAGPRIDPVAVSWAVRLADAAVLIISGMLAFETPSLFSWPPDLTTALAAIAIVSLTLRAPRSEQRLLADISRRHFLRHLAFGALRVLVPFLSTLALVLALLPADSPASVSLFAWLCLWGFGAVTGVIEVRLILATLVMRWREQGRLKETVAIYGTGDVAQRLIERLRRDTNDSVDLLGIYDDRAADRTASPELRSLIRGTANDLFELSRKCEIDRVIVALPHAAERRVLEIVNKLHKMPVEISLAPDLAAFNTPAAADGGLEALPLLAFYRRPLTMWQRLAKSLFDKFVAGLALVLLSPLLLITAIAIKLDSKGPVFFRQNRYGFGNRVIAVYKFRTMRAEASDLNGVTQTEQDDPRITRVGRYLRRWSIDELPQLLNVLQGEMSLVGPRAHAISMRVGQRLNEDIIPDYALRHHLKPGITGWAQVNGNHGPVASEDTLRARMEYDLEYINNWSLWFDIVTLLRTVKVCLGHRLAY